MDPQKELQTLRKLRVSLEALLVLFDAMESDLKTALDNREKVREVDDKWRRILESTADVDFDLLRALIKKD